MVKVADVGHGSTPHTLCAVKTSHGVRRIRGIVSRRGTDQPAALLRASDFSAVEPVPFSPLRAFFDPMPEACFPSCHERTCPVFRPRIDTPKGGLDNEDGASQSAD